MEQKFNIRQLQHKDRIGIKHLLEEIPQFTDEEKRCALELLDISLSGTQEALEYEFFIAEGNINNKLYGFISFGDISLTDGCYDLYWIVCAPEAQNNGIGTGLLNKVKRVLRARNGRKLFAETSSQADYASARNFYKKKGFKLTARIQDFYKIGDDKLIYVKDIYPVGVKN